MISFECRCLVEYYWQQFPVQQIPFSSIDWNECHQQVVLEWTVLPMNAILKQVEIECDYRIKFIKRWIQCIESQHNLVQEQVMMCLAEHLIVPPSQTTRSIIPMPSMKPIHKTYFLPSLLLSNQPSSSSTTHPESVSLEDAIFITLMEDPTLIAHGTTGLRTWEASFYLYHRILSSSHLNISRQSPIVELGSGCGLLGMALAAQGYHMILTDGHPLVLDRLAINIQYNQARLQQWHISHCHSQYCQPTRTLSCRSFPWESVQQQQQQDDIWFSALFPHTLTTKEPCTLICSDCVYDPHGVNQQLITVLKRVMAMCVDKSLSLTILIASTVRQPDTLLQFIRLVEAYQQTGPICFDLAVDFSDPLVTLDSLNSNLDIRQPIYCTVQIHL